jgi:hypothetical protein
MRTAVAAETSTAAADPPRLASFIQHFKEKTEYPNAGQTNMTSSTAPIPFVPANYRRCSCDDYDLWHHWDEPPEHLGFIKDALGFSIEWLSEALRFQSERPLHVCLYHHNDQAVASLQREVPANMAMAPCSTRQAAVITIQSPCAHPLNADHERMRRIFVHELCHLFVRESTEAEVILGDGLRDLAVRPWLDEGLAEVLSWRAVGARPPFVRNQRDGAEAWLVAELDKHLSTLSSNLRGAAFDEATRRVAALIDRQGLQSTFRNLVSLSMNENGPQEIQREGQ